ncbi:MAG TPA: radical SAM family heme chaperone HemW [Bacillales bacterium]|nr:radical SAM family heme chaperone HemW [Bacillales bacterium]
MPKAAYIHIPFCEHICYYCDFNKYFLDGQPVWDYLKALRTEMERSMAKDPEPLETIFVGGGTPTALDHEQMAYFLESIHSLPKADHLEFTIEGNPGHLDREKLALMKAGGVNRLSLGVQAFDDSLLSEIGRTHKSSDVFRTLELAKEVGFDNISIDLMYRLPGQSLHKLKDTLKTALSLDIQHMSIYSLQVEPRTLFYNRMKKGNLSLPGQDEEAEMYELLLDKLAEGGFRQYEISNFAKTGFESRHNQVYWENNEYFGFGAGAHGYIDGVRRVNAGWTKKYIRLIGERGDACVEEHPVARQEKMEDEMFLGLRRTEGVSEKRFQERFGQKLDDAFSGAVRNLLDRELIRREGGRLLLTKQGLFLGNEVFQEFISV